MENAEKFMGYSGMLKGDTGRSKENTRESTRVTRRPGRDTGDPGKTREDPRRVIPEIHRKYRRRYSLRDLNNKECKSCYDKHCNQNTYSNYSKVK
jgi:hypothetical protein